MILCATKEIFILQNQNRSNNKKKVYALNSHQKTIAIIIGLVPCFLIWLILLNKPFKPLSVAWLLTFLIGILIFAICYISPNIAHGYFHKSISRAFGIEVGIALVLLVIGVITIPLLISVA